MHLIIDDNIKNAMSTFSWNSFTDTL